MPLAFGFGLKSRTVICNGKGRHVTIKDSVAHRDDGCGLAAREGVISCSSQAPRQRNRAPSRHTRQSNARQLREQDLLTLHKGSVRIHDLSRLRKLAGFQGGYLNSRDLPSMCAATKR